MMRKNAQPVNFKYIKIDSVEPVLVFIRIIIKNWISKIVHMHYLSRYRYKYNDFCYEKQ